jgi:Protein of unknown function (DUF2914)
LVHTQEVTVKPVIAPIAFLVGLIAPAPSGTAQIEVPEAVIATAVVDRSPHGAATSFPNDVGVVYCFTRITGAEGGNISHIWFHEEQEMARVSLDIGSDDWRTWSTKRIAPEWTGNWRVDVVDVDGKVLNRVTFTIQ